MTDFEKYLHSITLRATQEAQDDGSQGVEAHHLLLAVAAEPESATQAVLSSAGLDRQAVKDALDREFEHSLRTAGVSGDTFVLPRPTYPPGRSMSMNASARLALERGFAQAQRKKDIRPAHLLLGILSAQEGTVPRALALAGVDRAALLSRVRRALSDAEAGR